METNKKTMLWGAAFLVVVAGLLTFYSQRSERQAEQTPLGNAPANETQENAATSAEQSSLPATTATTARPSASKTQEKPLSYGEAVEAYKDRRIQFDKSCVAVPNNVTYKNPVTLMLDNRSSEATKIVLNGKTYTIAGYSFTFVTLNEKTLPAFMYIDCGYKQNVAKITLQK